MTLILSFCSSKSVIQVSDRRLTTLSGEVYGDSLNELDDANKAMCGEGSDSIYVGSYTGMALAGGHTDVWLIKFLSSIKAPTLDFSSIMIHLRDHLTEQFPILFPKVPLDYMGTSFVFAGYGGANRIPFIWEVSNVEDDKSGITKTVRRDFKERSFFGTPNSPDKGFHLLMHGEVRACQSEFTRQLETLRRTRYFFTHDPKDIVLEFVKLIRLANTTKTFGKSIGRNCTSVILMANSPMFECNYHTEGESPRKYMPNMVGLNFSAAKIKLWTGPEPAPWS